MTASSTSLEVILNLSSLRGRANARPRFYPNFFFFLLTSHAAAGILSEQNKAGTVPVLTSGQLPKGLHGTIPPDFRRCFGVYAGAISAAAFIFCQEVLSHR